MMSIFSEIYGVYFRIAARLLQKAEVDEQTVYDEIRREGFRDSVLFLPQKLIPQKDGSDWHLFSRQADGTLRSVLHHKPEPRVTLLQKRWLRAKLNDPRLALFLSDEALRVLSEQLADIKPLYLPEHFRYTDRYTDGDPFESPEYRAHFRVILHALKHHRLVKIAFQSGKGERMNVTVLPQALEYSQKNDKFRLHCRNVRGGIQRGSGLINLGRMTAVSETAETVQPERSVSELLQARRCAEPVTVRVTPERNGVERFMMQFAAYEKRSERDPKTGCCTVQLWYDSQDETEVLIQLLSFGPVLEILSPPAFRSQAAARVRQQYLLNEAAEQENGTQQKRSEP